MKSYNTSYQRPKVNVQHFKTSNFESFFVGFAFQDLDSQTQLNPDLGRIRIPNDGRICMNYTLSEC